MIDWTRAENEFVGALEALGIFHSPQATNGRRTAGFHGPVSVSVFCSDHGDRLRLQRAIGRLVARLLQKMSDAGGNACLGFSMDVDPWAESSGSSGVLLRATATAASLQRD